MRDLARSGRPFLVFALVLALQPMTDAAMLSWFASPEALGWYGAARKLVGVLIFPASALIGALYPTLCRLQAENLDGFRATAADALYAVTIVVVPVALGCAFFPELGVAIFGLQDYGPAEDDLRVLALYLLLVYFSMPIGSCLAASGRQTAWTALQFGCVVVSVALDPLLIRWFEARTGNGGLGVCVATVFSELLMVAGGMWLLPKGVLTRVPRARVIAAAASGAGMALVALSSASLELSVRVILAVLAYGAFLQLSGGVNFLQLRSFLGAIRNR